VHTDAKAAESARGVSALAYTVGHNVVFGENRYAPATHAGRELLAHELAHTIQQRNASIALSSPEQDGILESSATMAARSVAAGQRVPSDLPTSGIGLSRSPDDDERAKLVAEAEAALAKMEEEERETAKEAAEEETAKQRRAEARIPTTLSVIHPDPQQITDEEISGEIEARKREEERATKERKEKELDESHDRLLILRGMLDRSGYIYSKNQVMAMITKDSLLDLQLLTRYGLELPGFFTKRKTFYHNVIAAIDKFHFEWRKTHGTVGPTVSPTDVEALEARQRQQEAEAARWEGLEHVEASLAGAVGAEATSWSTSDPKKITAGAKIGTAISGAVASIATAKAGRIAQGAIRESSRTAPTPPAVVGTKAKSEPPPTPGPPTKTEQKVEPPKPPAKSSQPAKATTQREMEETAAQKSMMDTAKGQKGSKGKATTRREMAEVAAQKTVTVAAKGEYRRIPGREPDIGVIEIRADGSVSMVVANREDVRALTGSNTHIALANAPEGLGSITEGARRYRCYLQNKVVTSVEPLGKAAQTPELVGVIGRALQRNGLASSKGTSINLSPGQPDETLKGIVFSR
jgi:hypothetical protein